MLLIENNNVTISELISEIIIFEKINMFNFSKEVMEYEMKYRKIKNPDQVLKRQQNKEILLITNWFQFN